MTRWFNTPLDLHRLWIEAKITRTKSDQKRYIDGQYKLVHEIGQGATSIVHLAIDINTNKRYAIKELNKSRLERQYHSELLRQSNPFNKVRDDCLLLGVDQSKKKRRLEDNVIKVQEIEILRKLPPHKNIIEFIKVIEDPEYNDSIFIVTEFAEKGIVMDIVPHSIATPYSDDQCRQIFTQLVEAIDHLHQHDIVHRDIKPQNLIMSNDHTLKLIDFGNATNISDMQHHTNNSVGSPAFMAPELLRKVAQDYSPTFADLWSMGVTLYCLAYGHLPFEKSSLLDLYSDIQNKPVTHTDGIDPGLIDLINKLLVKNPKDRITIKEIKEHPWILKKGE